MVVHRAQMAEEDDTVLYVDEVDISYINAKDERAPSDDPFLKVNVLIQENKTKKRYNELKKRLTGIDGAESKYVDPEQVNGYSLYDLVMPPYDPEALAQLYDEHAILRAVVDSRVMNTVALGLDWEPTLKAKKQIEKATKDIAKADRVRSAHQKEKEVISDILENLNDEETFIETMIRIWLDYLTIGNAYMEIGRTKTGTIGYIGHVPATLVRVRRPRDGFVQTANQKYVFFRNFGDKETPNPIGNDTHPNEMLHFKMYSPNNNYYGIPPSLSALTALVGDKFAKEFNIDYFENKAIPRYAIILKGFKISEKGKRELIQYFRNEVKGKNHGTLVIPIPANIGGSEGEVIFEKLEAGVQDASFDKYRKSNRDEVISAYRVPPTKVGIFENANLAVSRDADKTFKSQVVGPDQVIAEKRINRVISEFSDLFRLKFAQLDVVDEDMRSRIHDRYVRVEVMTPNEIRQEVGLPPIEGGDKMLPYPIKTGYQAGDMWPSAGEIKQQSKAAMAGKPDGGAEPGNQNANDPPKSGQDNGSNKSNADATGTNAERGQVQDSGKTRERSQ